MSIKKFIVGLVLMTSIVMQAEQWNCPKRVVAGDNRTQQVQARMMSTTEMNMNTIGVLSLPPRVPVILVNFANYSFSTTKAHADSLFNARTLLKTDLGTRIYSHQVISHGSVAKYFNDQSLGKYRPKFDVVGPVTLSKSYSYYGAGAYTSGHAGEMIREACTLVNDSVDFSQYDANGDGTIDLVFVFFAGFGENDRDYIDPGFGIDIDDLIWPHYSTTSGGPFDSKNLGPYECSNEIDGYLSVPAFRVPAGSGILVHEYSHGIGLPDVYYNNTQYMGWWDLMDYGCYNAETFIPAAYNGYQRWFCGWNKPKMMNTAKNDTLRPITSSGEFGVIAASGTVTGPHNNNIEYWIVENHQQEGWDMYARGEGLILYHMRHHDSWGTSANANATHDGYILLPADDTLRVSGYVGRQANCYPYQGKDSIILSSAPNYPITSIKQEINGDITLKVCGGKKPTGLSEGEKAKWLNGEKVLINGTMYIRRSNKLYTITGNETHIL